MPFKLPRTHYQLSAWQLSLLCEQYATTLGFVWTKQTLACLISAETLRFLLASVADNDNQEQHFTLALIFRSCPLYLCNYLNCSLLAHLHRHPLFQALGPLPKFWYCAAKFALWARLRNQAVPLNLSSGHRSYSTCNHGRISLCMTTSGSGRTSV